MMGTRKRPEKPTHGDGHGLTRDLDPVRCACGEILELTCPGGHSAVIEMTDQPAVRVARKRAPRAPEAPQAQGKGSSLHDTRRKVLDALRVLVDGDTWTQVGEVAVRAGEPTSNGRARVGAMLNCFHEEGLVERSGVIRAYRWRLTLKGLDRVALC